MSSIFSLCNGRPYSSFSAPTILCVFTSITSPDEEYINFPSIPKVIQYVPPGVSMVSISFGSAVLEKMWILLKMPSASQTSDSSGFSAMPWLGQPCGMRGRGVTFHFDFQSTLVTSTVLSILPVLTSTTRYHEIILVGINLGRVLVQHEHADVVRH